MAILRPRRGKKSDALPSGSSGIQLADGEVFFEYPEEGPGTGYGAIKMGKGGMPYGPLTYEINHPNNMHTLFTNSSNPTDKSNNNTYLNNIIPSNTLQTIFTNLKQLLVNFNYQLNNCIYPNETNVCGPSFVLHISSGRLVLPTTTPSNPVIGSIWIS